MRLYIQDNQNLLKYNLPDKPEGSILYNFISCNDGIECSLNIDEINGKWVLKSNGIVNIYENNYLVQEKELKEYTGLHLQISGANETIMLFCLPTMDKDRVDYNIGKNTMITLGSAQDDYIIFNQVTIKPRHVIMTLEYDKWYINVQDAKNVYVNDKQVLSKREINIGDLIFVNGLRILWMKTNFIIAMNNSFYSVSALEKNIGNLYVDNTKYTPVTEIENNLTLYNEKDYFSHIPRVNRTVLDEKIVIDGPPGKINNETPLPFILSIGSSFTMLGMMSINIFSLYDGIVEGTEDFIKLLPKVIMVVSMLVGSILLPILINRWQKKYYAKKEKERLFKFSKYLDEKEEAIKTIIKTEEEIYRTECIDVNTCIDTVLNNRNAIWCKNIKDNDFLELRLGIGKKESKLEISTVEEKFTLEDDMLLKRVHQIKNQYKYLNDVPVTLNLKDNTVNSITLRTDKKEEFINSILIQLLAFHSPIELKLAVFTNEYNEHRWDSLKYTKHNLSNDLKDRLFSSSQEEDKLLSQYLDNIYSERKEKYEEKLKEANEQTKGKIEEYEIYDTYYLIITDNYKDIKKFKFIQSLIKNQHNFGFMILVVDNEMKNIPNECEKFIIIDEPTCGMFDSEVNKENIIEFKAEYALGVNIRNLVRILANIPVQADDGESQLPTAISFLEMYNVGKIDQLNIRNRWKNSDPINSLQAPIGVHVNGDLFTLDLHEKFDGPHGLIAGSTGSGKSEFIITYILSMALNYDPKEVQFVLIDYKGGGLAGAFENRELGISIPHLAGTITNLDTAAINRSLVSINSELKRRQHQFNKVKEQTGESTMDIYKYQRLYREGIIDEPVSHLFIISDEFAELKAQQPDFMDELISTARIGRSLGVHLILATQKPSGVVNDQIWSNSKFKVCLKVATRSDSVEMLKRPEAASLKETGRFYLQVGYDEYFDIGQSAWSGEKYQPTERLVKKIDNSVTIIGNLGNEIKKSYDKIEKVVDKSKDLGDQLTNVVKHLNKISSEDGFIIKKLWLPPLVSDMILEQLYNKYKDEIDSIDNSLEQIVIGEYDSPAEQKQGLLTIDMYNNSNLIIYGVPGSGKESLISTIIFYLCTRMSPEDMNIYIGDFGAETLKIMSKFPQVGDAFSVEEEQKLFNLVKMLEKELETRKKAYVEYGGNFVEYNKLSKKKDKYIMVVLNNFENFNENYPRSNEMFNTLFREGPKYGISFILSTTQKNGLRLRVAENFENKICLKMPNNADYREVIEAPKNLIPAQFFGRGVISKNGAEINEFQTSAICARELRTNYIKEVAKVIIDTFKGQNAKKIPVLPDMVYVEDVKFELKGLDVMPIGIEKNSLEVYVYNFLEQKINLIASKSIKSHIYFIYALIKQMISLENVKVNIIDVLGIYKGNYENVNLYKNSELEKAFVKMTENANNDKSLKEKNVYFILGISEFKKELNKYNKNIEILFSNANKLKNNTFLFFDDSSSYKSIQIEEWYRSSINNTYGIWLGEDVGSQIALGVMSLTQEDKKEIFPCIGYPIYQGKHMKVKYVVDGVDKKDE